MRHAVWISRATTLSMDQSNVCRSVQHHQYFNHQFYNHQFYHCRVNLSRVVPNFGYVPSVESTGGCNCVYMLLIIYYSVSKKNNKTTSRCTRCLLQLVLYLPTRLV